MLKLEVIGNLGADAILRDNGNYKPFTTFPIAVSEKFTNRDNIVVERTIWVHCNINKNCDNLRPYLLKGTKVFVSGNCRLRTYQDNDKNIRAGLDCLVDNLELCGTRKEEQQKTQEDGKESDKCPF